MKNTIKNNVEKLKNFSKNNWEKLKKISQAVSFSTMMLISGCDNDKDKEPEKQKSYQVWDNHSNIESKRYGQYKDIYYSLKKWEEPVDFLNIFNNLDIQEKEKIIRILDNNEKIFQWTIEEKTKYYRFIIYLIEKNNLKDISLNLFWNVDLWTLIAYKKYLKEEINFEKLKFSCYSKNLYEYFWELDLKKEDFTDDFLQYILEEWWHNALVSVINNYPWNLKELKFIRNDLINIYFYKDYNFINKEKIKEIEELKYFIPKEYFTEYNWNRFFGSAISDEWWDRDGAASFINNYPWKLKELKFIRDDLISLYFKGRINENNIGNKIKEVESFITKEVLFKYAVTVNGGYRSIMAKHIDKIDINFIRKILSEYYPYAAFELLYEMKKNKKDTKKVLQIINSLNSEEQKKLLDAEKRKFGYSDDLIKIENWKEYIESVIFTWKKIFLDSESESESESLNEE